MIEDNLTIDDIRDLIIEFKNDPDFQKLENFYYSKSFSEILGVNRKETSHSGFLAWLLNNSESHSLSFYPIKKLLDTISILRKNNQKEKHKNLFNAFVTDDYIIKELKINPEFIIPDGRPDILVELRLFILDTEKKVKIVIENKVESKEGNDQTNKYYNYFEKSKGENEILIYVYLTPLSTLELNDLTEPECECKEFIQINYQSLVDYLLEPALSQNISSKTKNIMTEYIQSLSQPSIDDEKENQKQGLIMALGNEERKLLTDFWNKNQRLIRAALYAISSDPKQDPETRESIDVALEKLSLDKDRSIYDVSYNGVLFVQDIRKSDIGFQTVKLLREKGLINNESIEYLKHDKSCTLPLLKRKEDVSEIEVKYRKYRINSAPELNYNSEGFYVARNWAKDTTEKFIEKMTKKFPGIKYEIK